MKIGYIGSQNDLTSGLPVYEELYGTSNIILLSAGTKKYKFHTVDTVEEMADCTDLLVIGHEAAFNQQLLFHTVKKAHKLLLDIRSFLTSDVVASCIDFHKEAGNKVSFNISPALLLSRQIHQYNSCRQLQISAYKNINELTGYLYHYIIFGCCFLSNLNLKTTVFPLSDESEKVKLITITMSDMQNRYFHLSAGNYLKQYLKMEAMSHTGFEVVQDFDDDFYGYNDLLDKQVTALYKNNPFADLRYMKCATEVLEKAQKSITQKGFYL